MSEEFHRRSTGLLTTPFITRLRGCYNRGMEDEGQIVLLIAAVLMIRIESTHQALATAQELVDEAKRRSPELNG